MIRDKDLEFFRPVSRRYGITIFLAIWSIFEWLVAGSPFWGILSGALAVYCYIRLIQNFPAEPPAEDK